MPTINGFSQLRVQGTSTDAVAYAAAAAVPGATSEQARHCMTAIEASLNNRDYHLICGRKRNNPRKVLKMEAEKAYRAGQRMGFIPVGFFAWLFSSGIFWQIIITLVSHWIGNGGRWFADENT